MVRSGAGTYPRGAGQSLQPRRRAQRPALPRAAADPTNPDGRHDLLLHPKPGILTMSNPPVPRRTFLGASVAGLAGVAMGAPATLRPQPPQRPQPPPTSLNLGLASS